MKKAVRKLLFPGFLFFLLVISFQSFFKNPSIVKAQNPVTTNTDIFSGQFIPAYFGAAYDPTEAYKQLAGATVYVFAYDVWNQPTNFPVANIVIKTQVRADGGFQAAGLPHAARYAVYFPYDELDDPTEPYAIEGIPFRWPRAADQIQDVFSYVQMEYDWLPVPTQITGETILNEEGRFVFLTSSNKLDIANHTNVFPVIPKTVIHIKAGEYADDIERAPEQPYEIIARRLFAPGEISGVCSNWYRVDGPIIRGRTDLRTGEFQAYAPNGYYIIYSWIKRDTDFLAYMPGDRLNANISAVKRGSVCKPYDWSLWNGTPFPISNTKDRLKIWGVVTDFNDIVSTASISTSVPSGAGFEMVPVDASGAPNPGGSANTINGLYLLIAHPSSTSPLSFSIWAGSDPSGFSQVNADPFNIVEKNLGLTEGPSDILTGVVTFNGEPVPGATVYAGTDEEHYFTEITSKTDALGRYWIRCPPGFGSGVVLATVGTGTVIDPVQGTASASCPGSADITVSTAPTPRRQTLLARLLGKKAQAQGECEITDYKITLHKGDGVGLFNPNNYSDFSCKWYLTKNGAPFQSGNLSDIIQGNNASVLLIPGPLPCGDYKFTVACVDPNRQIRTALQHGNLEGSGTGLDTAPIDKSVTGTGSFSVEANVDRYHGIIGEPYAVPPLLKVNTGGIGSVIDCSTKTGVDQIGCYAAKYLIEGLDWLFKFLGKIVLYTDPVNKNPAVVTMWEFARSLTNVAYVIILVLIGITTILQIDVRFYSPRLLLPKLFVAILLTNTSMLIIQFFIDVNNIMTNTILRVALHAAAQQGINEVYTATGAGIGYFIVQGVLSVGLIGGTVGASLLPMLLTGLGLLGLVLLGLVATLVVQYAIRYAVIWICVILAPLGFAFNVLPFTKPLSQKWWSTFMTFIFMQTMVAVVLGVGLVFITATDVTGFGFELRNLIVGLGLMASAVSLPKTMSSTMLSAGKGITGRVEKMQKGGEAALGQKAWAQRIGITAAQRAAVEAGGGKWNMAARTRAFLQRLSGKTTGLKAKAAGEKEAKIYATERQKEALRRKALQEKVEERRAVTERLKAIREERGIEAGVPTTAPERTRGPRGGEGEEQIAEATREAGGEIRRAGGEAAGQVRQAGRAIRRAAEGGGPQERAARAGGGRTEGGIALPTQEAREAVEKARERREQREEKQG